MRILFLFMFAISLMFSVENIDEIIKDIKEKNTDKMDSVAKNPFSYKRGSTALPKPKPVILELQWIFNDRALINNKWYDVNDIVYGKRLVKIEDEKVTLRTAGGGLMVLKSEPKKQNDKFQIGTSE